jgi:hypothetical protein
MSSIANKQGFAFEQVSERLTVEYLPIANPLRFTVKDELVLHSVYASQVNQP